MYQQAEVNHCRQTGIDGWALVVETDSASLVRLVPVRTIAVSLDVGTDNETLLNDPEQAIADTMWQSQYEWGQQ